MAHIFKARRFKPDIGTYRIKLTSDISKQVWPKTSPLVELVFRRV